MAASAAVKDVVQMLAQVKGNAVTAPAVITKPRLQQHLQQAGTIHVIEPDYCLLHPWEPDFVPGYQLSRPSGGPVTFDAIWDAVVAGTEVVVFVGPAGPGKSTSALALVDRANEPVLKINRAIYARNKLRIDKDPDISVDDLEGYVPLPYPVSYQACNIGTNTRHLIGTVDLIYDAQGNKKPVTRYGSLSNAWVNGMIWLAEELNTIDPGVSVETHHFLDGRTKETMIYINGPQRIKKHDRFRAIITQNNSRDGANQLEFAGTTVQNTALINRFSYVVYMTWLPADVEVELVVKKTGIHPVIAQRMVKAATAVRAAAERDELTTTISTRDLLSWSREILREEKRVGMKHTDAKYWDEVVVASAYMNVLSCLRGDETSRNSILGYLGT